MHTLANQSHKLGLALDINYEGLKHLGDLLASGLCLCDGRL